MLIIINKIKMKVAIPLLLIILIYFTNSLQLQRNDGEREIKVFYDTLCPDAIKFIKESYKSFISLDYLQNKIRFILVPGALMSFETNENNETYFTCFAGENECLGNILHACAIYLLNIDLANQYIICYMENIIKNKKNNYETTNFCGGQLKFNPELLTKCVDSDSGTTYIKNLIKRKRSLINIISHSPWIVVDNKYDKAQEDAILENPTAFVCKMIKNEMLPICKSYSEFLSYK